MLYNNNMHIFRGGSQRSGNTTELSFFILQTFPRWLRRLFSRTAIANAGESRDG